MQSGISVTLRRLFAFLRVNERHGDVYASYVATGISIVKGFALGLNRSRIHT